MQRRSFVSALAATTFLPRLSFAQSRPIQLVVPFPPGGATDLTARILQEPLSRLLKQPVLIDNRGGAGGSIGMAEVAHAAPDGATYGLASLSTHGVNPAVYGKLPYDPVQDFVPVAEIVKAPGVMVINPKAVPATNMAGFVQYVKAHPGTVAYASPGNGTIGHLWAELFKSSAGLDMVHVPYRGAAPALNDLLAGQVAVYFDQVSPSLPYVKSGRLTALAVSWDGRLDVLPEVPTYAEAGYPAANAPSWFGLVAPKRTPPAQLERMRLAIATALREPDVIARYALQGLYPSRITPEAFGAEIVAEIGKMKKAAASAYVRLD